MRNRIIYGIVVLPILVALIRANTHPYFAMPKTYEILQSIPIEHTTIIAATIVLVTALMLLTTYLFKQYNVPKQGYLILLLSPPILSAAILNPYGLILALIATLIFVFKDKPYATILAILAAYIHPSSILVALILASYQAYNKKYVHATSTITLSLILAYLSPASIQFATRFAELQEPGAISIIAVLLAIVGIIQLWDQNTNFLLLFLSILLFSGLFLYELALISTIIAAALAGSALRTLQKRKWELPTIKTATTYFILLGLLFAATASTSQAITTQPTIDTYETAQLLNELTQEEVTVFTTQQAVLQWYGVDADYNPDLLLIGSTDELIQQANTYIVLEENYFAPRLRFLLENSKSYIHVQDAQHQIWRYTY